MKIAFVATYPPDQCGIATFTENLRKAMSAHTGAGIDLHVIAVKNENEEAGYSGEVKFIIRKNIPDDYEKAARYVNSEGYAICIIQHEYGIFGGDSGISILSLTRALTIPFIVTAHTVLRQPTVTQRLIMKTLAGTGDKIIVMSNKALQFLRDVYEIPADKITIIEHGVPEQAEVNTENVLAEMNLSGRKLLMTFGLLGRNKGIETVIRALPGVVKKHPDITYLVQGNTHPNVLRNEGEAYRESLLRLAEESGVKNHVVLRKGFMNENRLYELLHSVDIYITPYLREEQITSGTLSYALGAGAPIVSTPYWHARELLSNGRGLLFDFGNHAQLEEVLNTLLDDDPLRETLRNNALHYAHHLRWKNTGKRYKLLVEDVLKGQGNTEKKIPVFTEPGLKQIRKLTDNIGIYQHAVFGLPNYHEGYCLDDNARALIAMTLAAEAGHACDVQQLAETYLSFIHFMQQPDGWFHNFLSFDRKITDDRCSEDAYGRTLWALGYLIASEEFPELCHPAEEIFIRSLHHADGLHYIRGNANAVIGIRYFLERFPFHHEAHSLLQQLTVKMVNDFSKHRADNWQWFEDMLTYDNGILPLALFHAHDVSGNREEKKVAVQSTRFLEKILMDKGYLSLIGSNGWFTRNGAKAAYPQQAIDAMSMVLLFRQAYECTGDRDFQRDALNCYRWFFAENDLGIPLFDARTEGCYDGLEDYGLNKNQGAESTLALFISHYSLVKFFREKTGLPEMTARQ